MLLNVADPSQVAQARRALCAFATRHGATASRNAAIAIVITELATNLLKHGGGGDIGASWFDDADGAGVEVMALDRGPGMADVARCMQDGYSTAGSLGHGLGAVSRQSDHLRIWSRLGLGTAAAARFVLQAPGGDRNVQCGAVIMAYPGEVACGDSWAIEPSGATLLLADGTGHGVEAEKASQLATNVFRQHSQEPCEELVSRLHRALMPTRGAALAVARIDSATSVIRYAGVGNISGTLIAGGRLSHMVSHNGTAGHVAPRIREFVYNFSGKPLVVLHSDGLTTRWDLAAYPGLLQQHPSLIAGVLLRDFRRGRDDASVVAARFLG